MASRSLLLGALLVIGPAGACGPSDTGGTGRAAVASAPRPSTSGGSASDDATGHDATGPDTGRDATGSDAAGADAWLTASADALLARDDGWRVATDAAGLYTVALRSEPSPPPLDAPFALAVRVFDRSGGGPAADAVLTASAWMPAHGHGMARHPRARACGPGAFIVDGMLLHMTGAWELHLDVVHDGLGGRATFDVELLPPAARAVPGIDLPPEVLARVLAASPLPPPPADPTNAVADDVRAARLGQALFFDTALSGDGTRACSTCHDPARAFTDGLSLAHGVTELPRHTPSLLNVAYQRWLYWDGRRDTLWSQALAPLEHPREMAGDRVSVARHVATDPGLRAAYEAVFGPLPPLDDATRFPPRARPVPDDEDHPHARPDLPPHAHPAHPLARAWARMAPRDRDAVDRVFANVGKAIAAYERRLVTGATPFDESAARLRAGDPSAPEPLGAAAWRGMTLFFGEARCHLCHAGPAFTDREFHTVLVPPLRDDLASDPGRLAGVAAAGAHAFVATGPFSDAPESPEARKVLYLTDPSGHPDHGLEGQFRTPGLRQVALTAPYMHQGQLATLEDVVAHYDALPDRRGVRAHVEAFLRPLGLDAGQREDLVAFLRALTGAPPDPALLVPPPAPGPGTVPPAERAR